MSHRISIHFRYPHAHDAVDDLRTDLCSRALDDLAQGTQDPVEALLLVVLDALKVSLEGRRFVDGQVLADTSLV